MKYKILELTTSYREDVVPNTDSSATTSTVNCYLVAHCLYEFGTNKETGTVDADVYLIATKNYDSTGNITVTPGSGKIPSRDEVVSLLTPIIEDQIQSVVAEELYQALVRNATGVAETTINSYAEDNLPGLDIVSGFDPFIC